MPDNTNNQEISEETQASDQLTQPQDDRPPENIRAEYERKLSAERKRGEELRTKIAEYEAAQQAKEQEELAKQGEYKELAAAKDKQLAELKAEIEAERSARKATTIKVKVTDMLSVAGFNETDMSRDAIISALCQKVSLEGDEFVGIAEVESYIKDNPSKFGEINKSSNASRQLGSQGSQSYQNQAQKPSTPASRMAEKWHSIRLP